MAACICAGDYSLVKFCCGGLKCSLVLLVSLAGSCLFGDTRTLFVDAVVPWCNLEGTFAYLLGLGLLTTGPIGRFGETRVFLTGWGP